MPATTRTLLARRIKLGDRIETTNGMREVLKVEHQRWPKSARPYRVDLTVQDVLSEAGTVLRFEPHANIKTHRDEPREDPQETQDREVFINHYCFESGATREEALAAWAKR